GRIFECKAMKQPCAEDAPYNSVDEYRFAWIANKEIIAYSNRFRAFAFHDENCTLKKRITCSITKEALNENFKFDVDLDMNNRVFDEGMYSLEQLLSLKTSNYSNRTRIFVGENIYKTVMEDD
ncbi:MAG: hypothetical protein IKN43_03045, partial [Selenomonadaceae bacterium]|nr:hypothetical protein [Selenomonadaceae bacterium]